jgi:glycosyltransferase involved in cell wall biosynthesis
MGISKQVVQYPKKVLIIHNILWSHYKGIIFSELYQIMIENGYELKVIHIAVSEKGRESLGAIDLSIHNYPYTLLFDKNIDNVPLLAKTFRLLKEVIKFKPDLIVTPGWDSPSYFFIALMSKLLNIKTVISVDSTEFDNKRTALKETVKKIILKLYDASFTYGKASSDYVEKLGMSSSRIFVKLNAVHKTAIERLYEENKDNSHNLRESLGLKPYNFLFVGRLIPEKNIETLIEAFKNLKESSTRAELWGLIIVGDGPLMDKLKNIVDEYNISDVVFVGGKPWNETIVYYLLSSVFVLPSISEPWGLVVNEAMICGLPVIVSRKAGASFDLVVEGENGFIFEPTDVAMLTDIMRKFIDGEVDMEQMGNRSKEIIKDYTPQNVATKMLEGIKIVLEGR